MNRLIITATYDTEKSCVTSATTIDPAAILVKSGKPAGAQRVKPARAH